MNSRYAVGPCSGYVIRDRDDLPPDARVLDEGPSALRAVELLSLIAGTPVDPEVLLTEYGPLGIGSIRSVEEAARFLKLQPREAARVAAAVELGRRYFSPGGGTLPTIRTIEDVERLCRPMALLPTEQLRVLLLNSRYGLIHDEIVAIGGMTFLSVAARDVFQPAVERRAPALIIVHNHPSGDPSPSKADREFTKRMADAAVVLGVLLLDHVVIGERGFASCLGGD